MNAAALQAIATGMAPSLLKMLRSADLEQLAGAGAEALRPYVEDPADRERLARLLALVSAQLSPVQLVR